MKSSSQTCTLVWDCSTVICWQPTKNGKSCTALHPVREGGQADCPRMIQHEFLLADLSLSVLPPAAVHAYIWTHPPDCAHSHVCAHILCFTRFHGCAHKFGCAHLIDCTHAFGCADVIGYAHR
eukprot:1157329-Pelagomonas_calceolata.AAC.9